jgi:hypothetical protein
VTQAEESTAKLQAIRQKCIEANPGRWQDFSTRTCPCGIRIDEHLNRPVRLADVLLTIDKAEKPGELYAITSSGTFIERELKTITARILDGRMLSTGAGWNLRKDLDEQSAETISFLFDLLS